MSKIDLDSEKARRKRYLVLYNEYENAIKKKLKSFDSKCLIDEKKKTELEIEQFYAHDEKLSILRMEVYTKEESDQIINEHIKGLAHKVTLFTYLKNILQALVDNNHYTDEVEEIKTKITIEKLKDQIEAEDNFLKAYAKRKDITF